MNHAQIHTHQHIEGKTSIYVKPVYNIHRNICTTVCMFSVEKHYTFLYLPFVYI